MAGKRPLFDQGQNEGKENISVLLKRIILSLMVFELFRTQAIFRSIILTSIILTLPCYRLHYFCKLFPLQTGAFDRLVFICIALGFQY